MKNKDQAFNIRRAQPDDVLDMHEIFLVSWLATYANEEYDITVKDINYKFEQALLPEKLAARKLRLAEPKDGELILVGEVDGRIVGVCVGARNFDYNQLQAIYVLPEFQGRGLGRLMFNEVAQIFDKKKKIIVRVASYNDKAIGFYQRLGFVSTGKMFMDDKHKLRNGSVIPELEMEMFSAVV